jgi:hypothetical protein
MSRNGSTAFVRINGKRIYLGQFGSAEANKNYTRCIAEWASSRGIPGAWATPMGILTIDSLSTAFLESLKKDGIPSHYYAYRTATRVLLQLYSGVAVDSFTPKCLAAVQYHCTQYVDNDVLFIDFYFISSSWITRFTSRSLSDFEDTKVSQFYSILLNERLCDVIEHVLDDVFRSQLRQIKFFRNGADNIIFVIAGYPNGEQTIP